MSVPERGAAGTKPTRPVHPEDRTLHPALAGFPDAVSDVRDVAPHADSARLNAGCANFADLPRVRGLRRLWCFGAAPDDIDVISRCAQLEDVYLELVRSDDVSALVRLGGLRTLLVEGATRAAEFDQFAAFRNLERLGLVNFPRVTSLAPLATLTGLRALEVSGSIWTSMRVATLAPLAGLDGLRFLMLYNLRADDGSLRPLGGLTALEFLHVARFFTWQEFAELAGRLPRTQCQWFAPMVEVGLACEACGAVRVMLTGSRQPVLCPRCDQIRVEKHERRFMALVNSRAG